MGQATETPSATSSKPRKTFVEVKLLTDSKGGGLHSQEWVRVFEALDVVVQIQRANAVDKPEITERMVGTLRYVTAVGMLDRSGQILFPTKSFALGDGPKLKEWLGELQTYGAQGSPTGQPLWGLSKEQFARIYDSLVNVVDEELIGLRLDVAVAKLPIPKETPVRFGTEAAKALDKKGASAKVRQELKGFSAATALAVLLNDHGMGFRPHRTPAGSLELLVEPLAKSDDRWPIGWPLQRARQASAPKYFAMTTIELDQVALADVFEAIPAVTETPILIDFAQLDEKGIELSKEVVSLKKTRASWSTALKQLVIPKKMVCDLWQDEAGKTFVWITVNRPERSKAMQDGDAGRSK